MNVYRKTVTLVFACFTAVTVFSQTYNNPNSSIATCSGNFYDAGGSGGAYTNSLNLTTTFCSNNGGCIRVVFSTFNTESGFDYLTIYNGPSTASPVIGTYSGTTNPGTITSTNGCLTFRFTSDGSVTAAGWAATISCVGSCGTCSDGILNGGETAVDCGGPVCPACPVCSSTIYDSGGSGGNYSNSENTTNTYCAPAGQCISLAFTSFNLESCCDDLNIYDGATTGAPLIGTYTGTSLNGVTITSSGTCITLQFISDGSVVYSGWAANVTCGTCPTCTDGIQNGSEQGIDCGGTCPACPCPVNQVIGALPFTQNGLNTAGAGDDFSSTHACGSSYMNGDDYTFAYTPAVNQCISVTLTGTGTYVGVFITDACPSATCASCTAMNTNSSGNPSIASASLVAGTTYYITVSTWPAPQSTPFNINVQAVACGGSTGNDYCHNAQPITSGGGNLSGSTVGYTADIPSNLNSIFCGSIENNQWYSFVATATTATFNITAVGGGAACPYGIQAHVYSISGGGSCGTCANFASVSNCFNPGTTTTGTVNATGLTVGQTYYLMIDGNAGSGCTFTIANWANTTLPVRVIDFYAQPHYDFTKILWATDVEENIDYYLVERSTNGVQFSEIGMVTAQGNNHELKSYYLNDEVAYEGLLYYRLKAVDENGQLAFSDVITVQRSGLGNVVLHPNPATTQLIVSGSDELSKCNVRVLSSIGNEVDLLMVLSGNEWVIDVSQLPAGIYTIVVANPYSSVPYRFIKQ